MIPTVALQALLMLLATKNGFTQKEDVNCGAGMTTNTPICNELFMSFQGALVSNPANFYNLRKIFFPSSKLPPTLINVNYNVTFNTDVQIPCSDTNNSINSSKTLLKNYGWTSNTLYTVFHPATLNRMQPHLFYLIMVALEPSTSGTTEAALVWDGDTEFLTLHLFLNIKHLSCLPTHEQIDQTLQDLTSVLKVYARDQKNLTEWDSQNSHTLDGRIFAKDWRKHECEIYTAQISCTVYAVNNFFACLLTSIAGIIILAVLKKKSPKKENDSGERDITYNFYHSLMSACGIFIFICLPLFLSDFYATAKWKLGLEAFLISLQLLVIFILGLVGLYLHHKVTIDILKPSRAILTAMCCGCPIEYICCIGYRNCCKCLNLEDCEKGIDKYLHNKTKKLHFVMALLPLYALFLFVGYFFRSVIPVVMFFLIYRIRTLTFYTFVSFGLLFIILIVILLDFDRRSKKEKLRKEKKEQGRDATNSTDNATQGRGATNSTDNATQREDATNSDDNATQVEDATNSEDDAIQEEDATNSEDNATQREDATNSEDNATQREDATNSEDNATQGRDATDSVDDDMREVGRQMYHCYSESFDWLEHHFPLYIPILALFCLAVVIIIFILIYHTIVAQGTAGSALFRLFSGLVPMIILLFTSGAVGVRLKKYFKLEKDAQQGMK